MIIWLTGLPSSGKTTIAKRLQEIISDVVVLDGDEVRKGINSDLGYDIEARNENVRRIAEMAKLLSHQDINVVVSVIAPTEDEREQARQIVSWQDFFVVYCECPLEICEERDVKGLYKRARNGELKNMTGITSPYEAPVNPDLIVNTATHSLEECVQQIFDYVYDRVMSNM